MVSFHPTFSAGLSKNDNMVYEVDPATKNVSAKVATMTVSPHTIRSIMIEEYNKKELYNNYDRFIETE